MRQQFVGEVTKFITFWHKVSLGCCIPKISPFFTEFSGGKCGGSLTHCVFFWASVVDTFGCWVLLAIHKGVAYVLDIWDSGPDLR